MAYFRARARALDMLGRQQIAGIPTAINELFKNAHDAYADRVEVDFYRSDGLFVLRDNGIGMSRADFEERWLTLGTESKVASVAGGKKMPRIDASKPPRPILGEKGIGRLAIAAIGPQVLILTRASSDKGDGDLTAAFVQWSLFQAPGINLDQVQVPIRTFPSGTVPTLVDVEHMLSDVRANVNEIEGELGLGMADRIRSELDSFRVDPTSLSVELGAPRLDSDGHGTHFFIMPADSSLVAAIDDRTSTDSAPPLKKMLLGFTNTMTPGHSEPQIQASFRDHKTDDASDELIDEQTFFTPEEFLNADHHILGRFDEYGQFKGAVSVYGEQYPDHVVAWDGAHGKRTDCGPFSLSVAYVQGVARESTLPANEFALISGKLGQIGGLYIYKDGIRILPYGDNDYDFLDIEKNRTKSAGYYYFSYRRIFGVIEIGQSTNPELSEKAGREGFRENRAYRQFRAILMNFFVQIAADFFREGSRGAERYAERKAELDRLERARRRSDKLLAQRRKAFGERLKAFLKEVDSKQPELNTESLLRRLEQDIAESVALSDRDEASRGILDAESSANRTLQEIRRSFRVARPSGVGLSKQMRRDFDVAVLETKRLEDTVFAPAAEAITKSVGVLAAQAKLSISARVRIERAISERISETEKLASVEFREARSALKELSRGVLHTSREITREVDLAIQATRSSLAGYDMSDATDAEVETQRHSLEKGLSEASDIGIASLTTIKDDLRAMHWTRDEDGRFVGMNLMNEAMQEDLLGMREQAEADFELTQIGMALNVINHEFEASIRSVRGGLRRLKSWSDANPALDAVYTELRTNFDHIDGYLGLFTPLQRRLYRKEVDFTGMDIAKFIRDLFGRRLERHAVELITTDAFLKHSIHSYPSSFYPVFVNLIDNAIFWLSGIQKPRIITLDVDRGVMWIKDNGPGIPARDAAAIFDLGFTRKPGGRGLGLQIARDAMARVHYELQLVFPSPDGGTSFTIRSQPKPVEKTTK
jgi:signal transduction histidine kinase